MRCARGLIVVAGLACAAGVARADVIGFESDVFASTEQLGAFEGTLSYNPALAELVISITNTTPASIGGYLTGIVFKIDSTDPGATATLISANVPFQNTGSASAAPFGTFDAGAALGGNWLGGGSPNSGIAVGQTGVLTFSVSASDAASLTAMSFIGSSSEPGFVARFRGMSQGGSDKVPGVIPSPAGLAALAGAGVLAGRRRR
jgi:hypothetical protein